MKACDLHTHSVYSDGTYTPQEIIDSAIHMGLAAVALCDHNTVDGLNDFLLSAKNKPIEAIAGAEFSVDHNGKELHLLGLYLPEKHFGEISDFMKEVSDKKQQSNMDLIHSLNRAGYEIDYDRIKSSTPKGKFNRAHVAAELTKKGYTASIKEAFDTLLSPASGHYREPKRPELLEMIPWIRSMEAVPVLAHPFLNLTKEELEILLPLAKEHGLGGMECYYSLYDEKTTQEALALAHRFHLKCSGGSDFHGEQKPDIRLGMGKGNLNIPYDWSIALKRG